MRKRKVPMWKYVVSVILLLLLLPKIIYDRIKSKWLIKKYPKPYFMLAQNITYDNYPEPILVHVAKVIETERITGRVMNTVPNACVVSLNGKPMVEINTAMNQILDDEFIKCIIMHEVGHYECGHIYENVKVTKAIDLAREVAADAYAAKQVGAETYINTLEKLKKMYDRKLHINAGRFRSRIYILKKNAGLI